MMSLPPDFLDQLFIRKSCVFSGLTLLLYDYMITFPLEVRYIWEAPWTALKIGFLLNRYGNALGQTFIMVEETGYLHPSEQFCGFFRMYCTLFVVFSTESIRILVLMRAWAIWGYRYFAAAFLVTLYALYLLAFTGALIYTNFNTQTVTFEYLDYVGICLGPVVPYIWLIWLATLGLDSVTLAMVWYSLRKRFKESQAVYPSPLIRFLVRDAVMFYAASMFNNVFAILCWTVMGQDPRSFLQLAIASPILSIVGQRLILNLRGYQPRSPTTRDLSREVDRQIAAFDDHFMLDPRRDAEQGLPDQSRDSETSSSHTTGAIQPGLELTEVRRSQGLPGTIDDNTHLVTRIA